MNLVYFHNPKCSKSREGLQILESSGQDFVIKKYLTETLSFDDIDNILKKLDLHPQEIIRKKEPVFSELKINQKHLSSKQWIDIITENPILLERPILVSNKSAIIARPPDLIHNFLKLLAI